MKTAILAIVAAWMVAVNSVASTIVFEDTFNDVAANGTVTNTLRGWVATGNPYWNKTAGVGNSGCFFLRASSTMSRYTNLTSAATNSRAFLLTFDCWVEATTSNLTDHVAITTDSGATWTTSFSLARTATNNIDYDVTGYSGPYSIDINTSGWTAGQLAGFGIRFSQTSTLAADHFNVDNVRLSIGLPTSSVPVAGDDFYNIYQENVLNVAAPGVLANDSDSDGRPLSAELVSGVSNGALTFNTNGAFSYTPATGFTGSDSFVYRVYAGGATGNTATVHISILKEAVARSPSRPNILIYLVDDMGWGDCRSYNTNSLVPMPHVEKMAQQGMSFRDAHTQASLCAPSRYCILSGNYAWRGRGEGGIWNFNGNSMFLSGQKSIANVLQEGGYNTAMFGKYHLGALVWPKNTNETFYTNNDYDWTKMDFSRPLTNAAVDRGFNYAYLLPDGMQDAPYAYFETDRIVGDTNQLMNWVGGVYPNTNGVHEIKKNFDGFGMPDYLSNEVGPTLTRKAIEFIDRHYQTNRVNGTDTPFFMHYCCQAVHEPQTPPLQFDGTPISGVTGGTEHMDMMYEVDVSFGKIMDALEARGMLTNTLVILTSDNGGRTESLKFGQDSNYGLTGHKSTIYEGGHRVPLIIRWGDGTPQGSHIPPGTWADQLVGVHDLFATLAELVGKPQAPDQGLDSVSFLSILLDGNQAEVRDYLLNGHSVVAADLEGVGSVKRRAIREGKWKLTTDENGNAVNLYNLAVDLHETPALDQINNPAEAARKDRMQAKAKEMLALMGTAGRTTLPPAQLYPLTVTSGTGGGSYSNGQQVAIAAAAPVAGMTFDQWIGDTQYVNNVTYTNAQVTMPAQAVALSATYKILPGYYTLTVNGGTGSGLYTNGQQVAIAASNAPVAEMTFDQWIGDTQYVNNVTYTNALVTMPAQAIALTATYKDAAVYYLLTTSAETNGAVSPASTNVLEGNSATFVIAASNYYRIATLTTNGTAVTGMTLGNNSTTTDFTWSNVQTSGVLAATFTAQVTTNGPAQVPYSWLAQYGLTNYNTDAAADQDQDGLTTWQEYIAGTDPTNAASCFKATQNTPDEISWNAVSGRVYSAYWSTNLTQGFQALETNILYPQGSYTNATPDARVNHYQIKVRLE